MSHFILIMICTFSGHGVSIATANFTDGTSCQQAGEKFMKMDTSWFITKSYSCNAGGE